MSFRRGVMVFFFFWLRDQCTGAHASCGVPSSSQRGRVGASSRRCANASSAASSRNASGSKRSVRYCSVRCTWPQPHNATWPTEPCESRRGAASSEQDLFSSIAHQHSEDAFASWALAGACGSLVRKGGGRRSRRGGYLVRISFPSDV